MNDDKVFRLLDLPHELLESILMLCEPVSIVRISSVNTFLRDLVLQSPSLHYHLLLYKTGNQDNPRSTLSKRERMARLNSLNESWYNLKPDFTQKSTLNFTTSNLYDLADGVLLFNSLGETQSINFMRLPTKPEDSMKWNTFHVVPDGELMQNVVIVDFGLSIREHDLIAAVIAYVEYPLSRAFRTHRSFYRERHSNAVKISLALRQLSTSLPHPKAKIPDIHVHEINGLRLPSIYCEISGDFLVLITSYVPRLNPEDVTSKYDHVYVFNWTTGERRMVSMA